MIHGKGTQLPILGKKIPIKGVKSTKEGAPAVTSGPFLKKHENVSKNAGKGKKKALIH